jgi:hypothetical protein
MIIGSSPFQILHEFRVSILLEGYAAPFKASDIAENITVRPEAVTLTYSHPAFTIRQQYFGAMHL